MSGQSERLAFWYSSKQFALHTKMRPIGSDRVYRNFALIDGREVEYTCCGSTLDCAPVWDDARFLGWGTYSRTEAVPTQKPEPKGSNL